MNKNPSPSRVSKTVVTVVAVLAGTVLASAAWASGWPPFARADSIEVIRGGSADRLTSGNASVLDNDFDLERDKLTADLRQAPDHGELILREDGTFLYTHDGGNKTSDSFRYRAFDGTRYSRTATVDIKILELPNNPPIVIGEVDDQEAAVGVEYRLELAQYFSDPDDGDVLSFSAKDLPKSKSLRIDSETGVLSGTPVESDARNKPYNVKIRATDAAGARAELSFPLVISRDNRADLALSIELGRNPVTVGEAASWNIEISNQGRGDLTDGQLSARWTTAGPSLDLTAPGDCQVSGNGSDAPQMSCAIGPLLSGESRIFSVEGMQAADGDNTLIGYVTAEDRDESNNADLVSAQVVAAFSEGPTQTISLSGAGVDAGDLDADGHIDIVATSDETMIFFNNGNRAVSTPGVGLGAGTGGSAVALLDFNGDGSLDIAIAGAGQSVVEIFINDQAGGFAATGRLQGGGVGAVNDMVATDLNGDGLDELAITGTSGTMLVAGGGQGGLSQSSLSSGPGLSLATGDIDLDGDNDLAVVRLEDRAVDLHANDGDGTSFRRTRLNSGSVATISIVDLDADGLPELLLGLDGDDLSAPGNLVLRRESGGSYQPISSFGASAVSTLLPGDIDGDGWIDVVAINEAGVHQTYLGGAGGILSLAPEQILSDGIQRGVVADFNKDESLDLIVVGRNAELMEIHANNGIGRLGLGDRLAPDLQLNGEATINIPSGSTFVDPGATAIDDIDGDLTEQITVLGTIDPIAVGRQTLTYSVSDRAGNSAQAVRVVNVGVNEGTGGSGGGGASWPAVLFLAVLAIRRRIGSRN